MAVKPSDSNKADPDTETFRLLEKLTDSFATDDVGAGEVPVDALLLIGEASVRDRAYKAAKYRPALQAALNAAKRLDKAVAQLQAIEDSRPMKQFMATWNSFLDNVVAPAIAELGGDPAAVERPPEAPGETAEAILSRSRAASMLAIEQLELLSSRARGKPGQPASPTVLLEETLRSQGVLPAAIAELLRSRGKAGAGDAGERVRNRLKRLSKRRSQSQSKRG